MDEQFLFPTGFRTIYRYDAAICDTHSFTRRLGNFRSAKREPEGRRMVRAWNSARKRAGAIHIAPVSGIVYRVYSVIKLADCRALSSCIMVYKIQDTRSLWPKIAFRTYCSRMRRNPEIFSALKSRVVAAENRRAVENVQYDTSRLILALRVLAQCPAT